MLGVGGHCQAVSWASAVSGARPLLPTLGVTEKGTRVELAQAAGGAGDGLLPHSQFLGINGFIFLVLRKGR